MMKMMHFCLISVSVFALFIPSTLGRNLLSPQFSNDIINSTCRSCSEISAIFDYNFCTTTLQPVSGSHGVDIRGMAVIGMELAMQNATSTIAKIEKMITSQTYDPLTTKCLKNCLESYAESVSNVVMAMGAFMADQLAVANTFMSSVVEQPMNCEADFRHKKGSISLLAKENYDLFEIGIITICMINQASSAPAFGPMYSSMEK